MDRTHFEVPPSRNVTAYDAFSTECPTRDLLDRLSSKWVSLLLLRLAHGPRRYAELSRSVTGISPKMLTQTLRRLERDGVISRTVTPTVPIRTDYELTGLGHTLLPVMAALKTWTEDHFEHVQRARADYDGASAARVS